MLVQRETRRCKEEKGWISGASHRQQPWTYCAMLSYIAEAIKLVVWIAS